MHSDGLDSKLINTMIRVIFVMCMVWMIAVSLCLLTNESFNILEDSPLSQVFQGMWYRLSKLDPSMDPYYINGERWIVGDKSYVYWLPLPALVRGFLSIFGLEQKAIPSMIMACAIFAGYSAAIYIKVATIFYKKLTNPPATPFASVLVAGLIIFVAASPMISFLAAAAVYWESIVWAAAIFCVCTYYSLLMLSDEASPSTKNILIFSLWCGLAFFTRATIVVATCALFGVTFVCLFLRERRRQHLEGMTQPRLRDYSTKFVLGAVILTISGIGLGALNYAKWGDPLAFNPIQYHVGYRVNETGPLSERGMRLVQSGALAIDRIPEGFEYHFLPSTAHLSPSFPYVKMALPTYFAGMPKYVDIIELTMPITLFLPFFTVFAVLGLLVFVIGLCRAAITRELLQSEYLCFLPTFVAAMILLVLTVQLAWMSRRYGGDLLTPLVVFAALGFVEMQSWFGKALAKWQVLQRHGAAGIIFWGSTVAVFSTTLYFSIVADILEKQWRHIGGY